MRKTTVVLGLVMVSLSFASVAGTTQSDFVFGAGVSYEW